MNFYNCQALECLKPSSKLVRFYMSPQLFILVCTPCYGKLCRKKLIRNRPAFLQGVE